MNTAIKVGINGRFWTRVRRNACSACIFR